MLKKILFIIVLLFILLLVVVPFVLAEEKDILEKENCWSKTVCDKAGGEFRSGDKIEGEKICKGTTDIGDPIGRCYAKPPKIYLGVPIPGFSKCEIDEKGKKRCYSTGIVEHISDFYRYFIGAIAIIAVVMIMWGGFLWLTAAGNSSQIGVARTKIGGALIGLVLALSAYLILNTINPNLVKLKEIRLEKIATRYQGLSTNKCFIEKDGHKLEGQAFPAGGEEKAKTPWWKALSGIVHFPNLPDLVKAIKEWTWDFPWDKATDIAVRTATCNAFCIGSGKCVLAAASQTFKYQGDKEIHCCACGERGEKWNGVLFRNACMKENPSCGETVIVNNKTYYGTKGGGRDVCVVRKPGANIVKNADGHKCNPDGFCFRNLGGATFYEIEIPNQSGGVDLYSGDYNNSCGEFKVVLGGPDTIGSKCPDKSQNCVIFPDDGIEERDGKKYLKSSRCL